MFETTPQRPVIFIYRRFRSILTYLLTYLLTYFTYGRSVLCVLCHRAVRQGRWDPLRLTGRVPEHGNWVVEKVDPLTHESTKVS